MTATLHSLGRVERDADGDILAICACGERDCAEPWHGGESVAVAVAST